MTERSVLESGHNSRGEAAKQSGLSRVDDSALPSSEATEDGVSLRLSRFLHAEKERNRRARKRRFANEVDGDFIYIVEHQNRKIVAVF